MARLFVLQGREKSYRQEEINPNNQHILVDSLGKHNLLLHCNNRTYVMVEELSLGQYGTRFDGYTSESGRLRANIEQFNAKYGTTYTVENMIFINNIEEAVI